MNEKMQHLVDVLNKASKAYYSGDENTMTDKEYDELYDRLKQMEIDTGVVLKDSPTQHVGYEEDSPCAKVEHEYPSLSLDKTKDRLEMLDWLGCHIGVLSWKYDGLTIILTYDDGKLVRAETRGDGRIGEDVTSNARYFKNVPSSISDHRHIVIRGEAVISHSEFARMNSTLPADKQYTNPRNMAAGAVKMHNSDKSSKYGIEFIPFDLANAIELGFHSLSMSLIFIRGLGINTVDWTEVDRYNLIKTIDEKERTVNELPHPTDGLVVVYDNLRLCESIGTTRKYPKYAMAFKWKDELKTTVLRDIQWSVAKSGLISPVAIFDPVELEGTTVRRAGLHNISIARNLGLGIGDRIRVYKANMIIPKIYDDLDKTNNIDIPAACPLCGGEIKKRLGANNTSIFLYCVNNACPRIN